MATSKSKTEQVDEYEEVEEVEDGNDGLIEPSEWAKKNDENIRAMNARDEALAALDEKGEVKPHVVRGGRWYVGPDGNTYNLELVRAYGIVNVMPRGTQVLRLTFSETHNVDIPFDGFDVDEVVKSLPH
jgi:hypothetical protein